MQHRLYPQFLYRMPAFDWSEMDAIFSSELRGLWTNEDILRALYIASPGFYARLNEQLSRNRRLDEDSLQKLRHYLIRMSTRSTPFGAFSGIGVGQFDSKDDFSLVKSELDPILYQETTAGAAAEGEDSCLYISNPTLIQFGSLCRLLRKADIKGAPRYKQTRLTLPSSALKLLKAYSGAFSRSQAIKTLIRGDRRLRGDAEALLDALLRMGVIKPHRTKASFTHVMTDARINPTLSELRQKNESADSNFTLYFQYEPRLHERHGVKILSAAEKLSQIARRRPHRQSNLLLPALKAFLSSNNENPVTPFLAVTKDALTPFLNNRAGGIRFEKIDQHIANRLNELHQDGRNEWNLSAQEIDRFFLGERTAAASAESAAAVSALVTMATTAQGKFVFHVQGTARNSASRLHGRFGPLSPAIRRIIEDIHSVECKSSGPRLKSDIEFEPLLRKHGALMRRWSGVRDYIDLVGSSVNDRHRIPAKDLAWLYEGVGEPQLISLSKNLYVDPLLTGGYSYEIDGHFYYQLLGEYSQESGGVEPLWDWGASWHFFEHFPRVRYGDLVIARETWVMRPPAGLIDHRLWLDQRLSKSEVPSKVFLMNGDQMLFCDLSSEHGRTTLVQQIKTKQELALTELLENELQSGREIIITGLRDASVSAHRPKEAYSLPNSFWNTESGAVFKPRLSVEEPLFLYIKLYLNILDSDSLLFELKPLLKETDWFFIRYQDPEAHLRVRIFFKSAAQQRRLSSALGRRLDEKLSLGFLYKVVRSSYHREVGRYGGRNGLLFFERLSCLDSLFCLQLLNEMRSLDIPLDGRNREFVQKQIAELWISFFWAQDERKEFVKRVLTDFYIKEGKKTTRHAASDGKPDPRTKAVVEKAILPFIKQLKSYSAAFSSLTRKWPIERKQRFCQSFIHISFNRLHAPAYADDERSAYLKILHDSEAR